MVVERGITRHLIPSWADVHPVDVTRPAISDSPSNAGCTSLPKRAAVLSGTDLWRKLMPHDGEMTTLGLGKRGREKGGCVLGEGKFA